MPVAKTWADFDFNFRAHPNTGKLSIKQNADSIISSLKHLLLTNHYERPFHPEIGSSILSMLFELVSPTTGAVLKSRIREVLTNYEPRAIINDIQVSGDIDRNGYYVSILFTPINTLEPVTIELFLERLR